MTYEPEPIDTTHVELSPTIMALTELLARNVHEAWACQRIAEGWTHGPTRDDQRKEHPDLVPYEKLPESEKDYDRMTAIDTLKAIVALGYVIQRS